MLRFLAFGKQGPSSKNQKSILGASNNRIGFLDSVRGIAILLVFFLHATNGWVFTAGPKNNIYSLFYQKPEWFASFLITFGHMGVAIFFVVSGFCIHLSFLKTKDLKIFYFKRFFRIYPPYLAALLFFSFLSPYCNLSWVKDESCLKVFLQHLFLINNFREGGALVLNPSFWSIATEVQLYLLYPIVLIATKRWGWKITIMILFMIEFSLRVTQIINGGYIYGLNLSPFMFWFSWSIGAYVCEEFLNNRKGFFSKQSIFLWLAACFLAHFINILNNFEFPCAACATATYIANALDGRVGFRLPIFADKIIKRIGIYSFGIYLLHQPFFWLAYHLQFATTPRINARLEHYFSFSVDAKLVVFCYCMLIGVGVYYMSSAFYKLVEMPSVYLGDYFVRRRNQLLSR
jgi:peptidoglycan/LPS O-acetylase OafA/YrhL